MVLRAFIMSDLALMPVALNLYTPGVAASQSSRLILTETTSNWGSVCASALIPEQSVTPHPPPWLLDRSRAPSDGKRPSRQLVSMVFDSRLATYPRAPVPSDVSITPKFLPRRENLWVAGDLMTRRPGYVSREARIPVLSACPFLGRPLGPALDSQPPE